MFTDNQNDISRRTADSGTVRRPGHSRGWLRLAAALFVAAAALALFGCKHDGDGGDPPKTNTKPPAPTTTRPPAPTTTAAPPPTTAPPPPTTTAPRSNCDVRWSSQYCNSLGNKIGRNNVPTERDQSTSDGTVNKMFENMPDDLGFDREAAKRAFNRARRHNDDEEGPTRNDMKAALCAGLGMSSSCTPQDLADRGITSGFGKPPPNCGTKLGNGNCFGEDEPLTTDQLIVFMDRATKVCPSGWSGSYPSCSAPRNVPVRQQHCPSGWSGTYPNCRAPVQRPTVSVSTDPATVAEGATMTFEVSLTRPRGNTDAVTVDYAAVSRTGAVTGTAGSDCTDGDYDYTLTASSGELSWASDESDSKMISVPVCRDDHHPETAESVTVELSEPDSADIHGASASGLIESTPPEVSLSASRYEAEEGVEDLMFVLVLESASGDNVTVDYTVTAGTASTTDFRSPRTRAIIPAGDTTATVVVHTVHDTDHEPDETLTLTLTAASGASLGSPASAVGVIVDNDPLPVVSLHPVELTVREDAGTATFNVTLDKLWGSAVTVDVATSDGTEFSNRPYATLRAKASAAAAGSDYTSVTRTVTIAAGSHAATFDVAITDDSVLEPDQSFTVTLTNPRDATLGAATATGTIADDEPWRVDNLDIRCVEDSGRLRLIAGWDPLDRESTDRYNIIFYRGQPVSSSTHFAGNTEPLVVWNPNLDWFKDEIAHPARPRDRRWPNQYNRGRGDPVWGETYTAHIQPNRQRVYSREPRRDVIPSQGGLWSHDTVVCPTPPAASFDDTTLTVAEGDTVSVSAGLRLSLTISVAADAKPTGLPAPSRSHRGLSEPTHRHRSRHRP